METKDSASLPSAVAAAGSDGEVLADDGGIASAKAALAREAVVLFQSRRYNDCQDVLNQLLQKYGDDPKVLHNIAVAEYFKDGGVDPKKLLYILSEVEKRGANLALASQLKTNPSDMSPNASNVKMATAVDADYATVRLNKAIILYRLHEYNHASALLEPLYKNLELVDERIAFKVCLLLIDIALASQDVIRAANVIQYMENAFGVQTTMTLADTGATTLNSSGQAVKDSRMASGSAAPDYLSESNANATSDQLSGGNADDTTEYESLITTLDNSNGSRERSSSNDYSRAFQRRPSAAFDGKIKLQFCKVRALLLARDLKAATSEIKQIMDNLQGRDSVIAFFLRLHLEYAHGNCQKATELLMAYGNKQEAWLSVFVDNNLGCIFHQLESHQFSAVLFSKALKSSHVLRSQKPLKLATFSQDKSNLIIYNCGLQYLACGKPLLAAQCFYKASVVLARRPLLWLRFAESCLLALQQGLLHSSPIHSHPDVAEVSVVGSGKMRQLFIHSNSSNRTADITSQDGLISDIHKCRLSIPFARQCLVNALFLLDRSYSRPFRPDSENFDESLDVNNLNQKSSNDSSTRTSIPTTPTSIETTATVDSKETAGNLNSEYIQNSVFVYEESVRKQTHLITQAVLADLAYVELCLENPLRALGAARRIQQLPDCSKIYIFLSRLYSAEALCRLNRLSEAAEQLSSYLSEDISLELPYHGSINQKSHLKGGGSDGANKSSAQMATEHLVTIPLNPEEGRGLLYVDLAAVFAMQGDFSQADHYVREAISLIPNNPRAILAAVYLDLRLGRAQDALSKLRWCSHIVFFPTG